MRLVTENVATQPNFATEPDRMPLPTINRQLNWLGVSFLH